MKRLTTQDILLLHNLQIEATGGLHGLRDFGALEASVERPWTTFGGDDLYPTIVDKAAALMHSTIKNHSFVEGNKRTGMHAAMTFLEINRHHLQAAQKEVERFALRVAAQKVEIDEIATWLRMHTRT